MFSSEKILDAVVSNISCQLIVVMIFVVFRYDSV